MATCPKCEFCAVHDYEVKLFKRFSLQTLPPSRQTVNIACLAISGLTVRRANVYGMSESRL